MTAICCFCLLPLWHGHCGFLGQGFDHGERRLSLQLQERETVAQEERRELLALLARLGLRSADACEVRIAIVDGPVDFDHPCFRGSHLSKIGGVEPAVGTGSGLLSFHGTAVTSIIFGQPESPVPGLCPDAQGLIVPVFRQRRDDPSCLCTQAALARGIDLALDAGAQLINVSGGEHLAAGELDPALQRAVQRSAERGALILASAGNDGCQCLHSPASLSPVLAVGATTADGDIARFSNWGADPTGIVAPGVRILVAMPGGKVGVESGTSYATAIVTAVASLLLGRQRRMGQRPDPMAVKAALLQSAEPCQVSLRRDCERFLGGTLNIATALAVLEGTALQGRVCLPSSSPASSRDRDQSPASTEGFAMYDSLLSDSPALPGVAVSGLGKEEPEFLSVSVNPEIEVPRDAETAERPLLRSACGDSTSCGCGGQGGECSCQKKKPANLVYALGSLGYTFRSEAARDALAQRAGGNGQVNDLAGLLRYLDREPAASIHVIWTLNLDLTPIYALAPTGPNAIAIYERLRAFAAQQLDGRVQRISVPGVAPGKDVKLLNGYQVPVLVPEFLGLYAWSTTDLVAAVVETSEAVAEPAAIESRKQALTNFLERIYSELRNQGASSQERALNFAATNAFQADQVFAAAVRDNLELDRINVAPSPICRPHSDCWDVTLTFFDPRRRLERARQVYRFAVDVGDLLPVTIGAVRSYAVY